MLKQNRLLALHGYPSVTVGVIAQYKGMLTGALVYSKLHGLLCQLLSCSEKLHSIALIGCAATDSSIQTVLRLESQR